ncbi:MAG: TauD/TfdA family dioxygenase [Novosphingobium sp.]|nr:TauD/TfdA family dioxygenase [Novosphingobium sp.]
MVDPAGEWRETQGLRWRPLAPFGAEIYRDLAEPLSVDQERAFVELLWAHALLLARGQSLAMERQRALCGLAGPILLRAGETGIMTNEGGGPSATELAWHADAAYTDAPFDALSLHALDVVDEASSTRFVHAGQALARLPPELRARLEHARVEMISPGYDALGGRTCDRRDPPAQKRGEQPAIRVNPHTGEEVLWVGELQAARVLGMAWEESRDLLHAVYDHLYQPGHVHEHRWRTGDLVIWDNIALQHMRGGLENCGRRVLQRVIVGTEGVAPHIRTVA